MVRGGAANPLRLARHRVVLPDRLVVLARSVCPQPGHRVARAGPLRRVWRERLRRVVQRLVLPGGEWPDRRVAAASTSPDVSRPMQAAYWKPAAHAGVVAAAEALAARRWPQATEVPGRPRLGGAAPQELE
jgi:hypothetical protein